MAEYRLKSEYSKGEMAQQEQSFSPAQTETATAAQPPPSFQTTFASLSLHMYDRIRLLDFPPYVKDIVRQAITSSWPLNIQEERAYAGSHEFKLRGNPWHGQGDEAMYARRLMRRVFESLWNAGWLMSLSTDVSKKKTDKDTLIFRYQSPPPPPCEWISISFSRNDRIRLMNAPQDLRDAIIADIRLAVQESRRYTAVADVWEIKLHGSPWRATGEETMAARRLLLRLVTVLERFGFTVYASIDQKATPSDHVSESDTWHCRRQSDWIPGTPVYHQ